MKAGALGMRQYTATIQTSTIKSGKTLTHSYCRPLKTGRNENEAIMRLH